MSKVHSTVEAPQHPQQKPKICFNCKQAITGNVTTALGQDWHPEHFCCSSCDTVIKQSSVRMKNDEPICKECFVNDQPQCGRCEQPILDVAVSAINQLWHPACFICSGPCRNQIENAEYSVHDGKPYCNADYDELFGEKCCGCKKVLRNCTATRALDGMWHPECLKCAKCHNKIEGQKLVIAEGKALCENCNDE